MQRALRDAVVPSLAVENAERNSIVARQNESILRVDEVHLAGGLLNVREIDGFMGLVGAALAVIELDQHHQLSFSAAFRYFLTVHLDFDACPEALEIRELRRKHAGCP